MENNKKKLPIWSQICYCSAVIPILIVKEYIFWGDFCLDHSKLKVVLQNYWISLMTDDFKNLWKSEHISNRTTQQQNESWSQKSSALHNDETSQYLRATRGSRFICLSKIKVIIRILELFKSDFAYSLKSCSIFKKFRNARLELARKISVEI